MKQPVIYYFCPDLRGVVGGVKTMYRHVDILNRNHFSAAVLHSTNDFRCDWFENNTRIAYVRATRFETDDIIVFPESLLAYFTDAHNPPKLQLQFYRAFSRNRHKFYLNELSKMPARKVIFNQGVYLTFKDFDYSKEYDIPYLRRDVVATICISEDSHNYLSYVFPRIPIYRVHLSANKADFYYQDEKKPQIAFMADRNKDDWNQVLNILKIKNLTSGFRLVPIKNKTEKEVGQILRESAFFFSFGKAEGFSLPPLEAMICGCVVVGYHGGGGREYFDPAYCYPVEPGDIIDFARKAEEAVTAYRNRPSAILNKGKIASERICLKYDARIEETDLIKVWSEILETNRV
ncbi:MAG: glycosyltransferase [Acidobacteria bacterium]|nr:glycosyltransferase [Acidobacteriota bacterium]